MKSKTWLVIDAHFLCWRAFHTTGELKHGDVRTGVLYGFFRDLINFTELHSTRHVMFAFDRRPYRREKLCKGYKQRQQDPAMEEPFAAVREQIHKLRTEHLKALGYRNVFSQPGYEADDVIASFVKGMPKKDKAVIVSADHDLYQLLDAGRVVVWNPNTKKAKTEQWLADEHGVTPDTWPHVMAVCGCNTDKIPGVRGIGEKLACKYLNGHMKAGCKAYSKINDSGDLIDKNLKLVRLPFSGCNTFVPKDDNLDRKAWKKLLAKLGMSSLLDRYPAGV